LSDEQLAWIAEVASRPHTWLKVVRRSRPGAAIAAEFDALAAALGPAAARQLAERTKSAGRPRVGATSRPTRRPVRASQRPGALAPLGRAALGCLGAAVAALLILFAATTLIPAIFLGVLAALSTP